MIMQNFSIAALLHRLMICVFNCIEKHKNGAEAVRDPPYPESAAGNAGHLLGAAGETIPVPQTDGALTLPVPST